MPEAIRLAVFDCDGTLVDSQHSIIAAMHAAFDRRGVPRATDEAIRRVVGLPLFDAISVLAPDCSPDMIEIMRGDYSTAWQEMRSQGGLDEPLYPGTVEVLDQLADADWLLGVATGKSHRGLVGTLEKHDVLDRFITLQTADRARGKPHPEMLFNAMNEAGAEASHTAMIGDTTFDMEMAHHAGVMAIGVAWGYHDVGELEQAGAKAIISGFGELAGILQRMTEDEL